MTARCELHPAYEADYCPVCGTAVLISERGSGVVPAPPAEPTPAPVEEGTNR